MGDRDFLEHHGIKGQKWGVRRTPEQLGYRIKSGAKKVKSVLSKRKAEKEARVRKKPKRISLKKMSDQELENRLKRLRKEKEYRELSKAARNRGANLVIDILEKSIKRSMTDVISNEMTNKVKKIFNETDGGSKNKKELKKPKQIISDKKLDNLVKERKKAMKQLGR